jgi:hypothetical protein
MVATVVWIIGSVVLGNLGLTNLKGQKILFITKGVSLLLELFTGLFTGLLYCMNFVIEGFVILRFQCTHTHTQRAELKLAVICAAMPWSCGMLALLLCYRFVEPPGFGQRCDVLRFA